MAPSVPVTAEGNPVSLRSDPHPRPPIMINPSFNLTANSRIASKPGKITPQQTTHKS